ncbi:uncharacterized protein LOC114259282 [Camellia sinensis]|uniref:uncharacterized protein LOC114259282 n=1 Tax=Camellia sinensis TaxID=4442 RepID=UPI001035D749|nr:uncharacterized protein LOC114259282 [Camellia sinensis]
MATDQRASSSPLLLLLLSLLISAAAAALASRRRWPFQRCFSSHRCCFSLSGLCFLIHCENNDSLHSSCWPYWSWFWIYEWVIQVIVLWRRDLYDSIIIDEHFKGQRCAYVFLPVAACNNQSGLCTHCLFY